MPARAWACSAACRPDTECPGCENRRMTAPDSDRGAGLRPPKWRIGPQRALFDNPVGSISMEEVTDAVLRLSEPDRSQTVASLADDVLDELAIKRTPRAREIVMEAIRLARRSHARPDDVAPAARQAPGGGRSARLGAHGTLRPRRVRLHTAGDHRCLQPGTSRLAVLRR